MCLDYDYCKVWNPATVRARKAHRCSECSRIIQQGELYRRISWVDDDGAGTTKVCWICREFHELLADLCGESQQTNGGLLGDSLSEHEDYWREAAGNALGIPYAEWVASEYLLGPGLVDVWQALTGQVQT